MSARLKLQDLVDLTLADAPTLARELMNVIQDELDAHPQYFVLREGWRKVRGGFTANFEAHLIELLQVARCGEDPLNRTSARSNRPLDGLGLLDEQQAQQDVAIAQVTQACEETSRAELFQLGNFFAALRGIARARDRENPLRPALFAHALQHALSTSALAPQARHELMRVAAQPMARTLHRLYLRACAALRAANLSDMVAAHGQDRGDAFAHRRLAAARDVGSRGTLDGLARRVDALNSDHAPLAHAAQPFVRPSGPDMLSRLYDQILADPRLLPPMKALLGRLQIAVVRLARADTSLLRRDDHPTWALLNRVAAHGMGFERADDDELQDFLRFMDAEAQRLVHAPTPTAALFQQTLEQVDAYIAQKAHRRGADDTAALAALEREQQRNTWRKLVREQIDAQIADTPLGPRMCRFMQTTWVDVIADAMVRHGRDSREALDAVELVDAVLDSLITPRDQAARESLRLRLPVLIGRLNAGCDDIDPDPSRREAALNELMSQHARLLRGQPAINPDVQRPAAPTRSAAAPASADEIVRRLMEERDGQLPSMWMHADVNRSELPTVPVQLYSEHHSPQARTALQQWIDGLQPGRWVHLCLQGDWHTVQIAWISEGRQYLFLVGREPKERLSLTRRALEALLANGLITALDDDSLVQRAVDTLMSDLADH